jgi:hypothetical protein
MRKANLARLVALVASVASVVLGGDLVWPK